MADDKAREIEGLINQLKEVALSYDIKIEYSILWGEFGAFKPSEEHEKCIRLEMMQAIFDKLLKTITWVVQE